MLYLDSQPNSVLHSAAPKASSLLEGSGSGSEINRAYTEIFDAVMDRRLLPGAKLTESALCRVFACSRATARGALAQLAHDKIVVLLPNRGAFVRQLDAKETQDVFQTRQAIECLILQKLLKLPDLADCLTPLYEMVRQERAAFEQGDRISWMRLSNAFHVRLTALLGNQVLTELMHGLCSRTTLILAYHDTPASSTCSYIEHEEILNLLAAGDGDGVAAAMHHHLQDCEQRVSEPKARGIDPWTAFSIKRYDKEP